ncbi:oligosaccharide flippase family protein [Natrialba swarupiae]|uniref:Oligosaccharide flippase family protein n=1 Tax=Natrialba swarupiae TaxID=2448032 RepID=A0A5D5AHS0_9EURY|nr:polysaccharide biosynthesis C-terminal domain-containing protein [Natrialba swarupiae]TYT60377.1 oligosaccharide flippase family protein [Natrialba swarupiae]
MRLGQTSIIYALSKFVASGIGFFATIYLTRTLGEEIYGFYAITLALVSWLGLVKGVGFGNAIIKRMSEGEEPDAYLAAGTLIKTVLTFVVATGILVFQDQVNDYVGQPVAEFVVLLLIVSIFTGLVNAALKGSHMVHIYAPLSTLREAGRSVAMVALVVVGWELSGMLLGHALGTAVMATIGLWIVRPSFVRPRWQHVVRLFDFAKFSWLGSMRKKTFSEADILILGLFVPAGFAGIYAVAYSLSKFLEIFGSAIQKTLFPEMSKRSAQEEMEMIETLTDDALTFAGFFLVPGVVGAAILGDRLLLVYGSGFDIGHWILVILLVGLTIYTYTKQLLNTLNAIDRPDLAFRANGIFIVANVVLNVVLVYSIGWFGAAIATASSAVIGFVLSLYYCRQFIDVRLPVGEIGRQWIAAVSMGGVVYLARAFGEANLTWVDDYNFAFVVLLVGLGAAIYFVILILISRRIRTTISRNLPSDVPIAG